MNIAGIAVAAAVYAIDKPYEYEVPETLWDACRPGTRVVVPFGAGNRRTEGLVLTVRQGDPSADITLKAVETVLDDAPVLDAIQLRLAAFLRERYFCTFFDAIHAMLPAGLWFKSKSDVVLTAEGLSGDLEKLLPRSPQGRQTAELLRTMGGHAAEEALTKFLDAAVLEQGLRQLYNKKLAVCEGSLIRNVNDKTEKVAVLAVSAEEAQNLAAAKRRAPMQKALLDMLVVMGSCSVKELCYFTGAPMTSVRALEKSGCITLEEHEVFRRPEHTEVPVSREPIQLQPEQQQAFEQLRIAAKKEESPVSLLYGVTGSGKTMVYLKLIEEALAEGKTALVLVPEIALTPQLLEIFLSRFGDQVAVLHSALRVSQRYDEWKRIRTGLARVVLGTRSAVFAPLKNPGLIVVDEEHESTYKSEMNPRYHAREVAIWRGSREGAAVVLGSATPSLTTMYLAKTGSYGLVRLKQRYNGRTLPRVLLTDMREELKQGNSSPISQRLREEIDLNLDAGQQTILFLNRRGTSRTVLCPVCGYVPHCTRCSVSLTFHAANGRMMCHYCGFSMPADGACPRCGTALRQVGTGTQKVEEELQKLWPGLQVLRMDADTVSATNSHEKILTRFREEKIPILIGTQMVTKGLNFPNVTLVGVLDGDSSLYTDDFRAAETTFAKISQVIGRAGRGELAGRAVIQTMTPENQVLLQAAAQDYDAFYGAELPLRQLQGCPPFSDMIEVSFYGPFERDVMEGAVRYRDALGRLLSGPEWSGQRVMVMGPAPARIVRVMNRYHYRLTILAKNTRKLRNVLASMQVWYSKDKNNKNITACVDVNPLG